MKPSLSRSTCDPSPLISVRFVLLRNFIREEPLRHLMLTHPSLTSFFIVKVEQWPVSLSTPVPACISLLAATPVLGRRIVSIVSQKFSPDI